MEEEFNNNLTKLCKEGQNFMHRWRNLKYDAYTCSSGTEAHIGPIQWGSYSSFFLYQLTKNCKKIKKKYIKNWEINEIQWSFR